MKVLLIPDSYGWAYDFMARGVKSFSKHDITICPVSPASALSSKTIASHDVIFCFSRWIWNALKSDIRKQISEKPLIMWCCGSYFAYPPPAIDRYAVCTEKLVKQSCDLGITNAVLLREGVNADLFRPLNKPLSKDLRVGWAGNPKKKVKRVYLLKNLKYPVKVKGDHGPKFFVQNRSQAPMVAFYNNIDVYVSLATQNGAHGVGKTILEAMSCGLAVIATDICSTSKAVPRRWLIPSEPEDVTIKEANLKLGELDKDRNLLAQVGKTNREFIVSHYSWKVIVKDWDRLFEEVASLC